MKKLIYAATATFACVAAIPVIVISSSLNATASASELACQTRLGSTTNGGSVREQLSAIAQCNSSNPSPAIKEASIEQSKNMVPLSVTPNSDSSKSTINGYPSYCPDLPVGTQPGSFAVREALQLCNFGS